MKTLLSRASARFGTFVPLTSLWLFGILGCSSAADLPGPTLTSPAAGEVAQASVASCEGDLTKDPGICKGYWEYVPACYEAVKDPSCGISAAGYEKKKVEYPRTCAHPMFGLLYKEGENNGPWVGPDNVSHPPLVETETHGWLYQIEKDTCWFYREKRIEQLRAESKLLPSDPRWSALHSSMMTEKIDNTYFTATCTWTITDVPHWKTGTDATACGTYTVMEDDLTKPIYNACRQPKNQVVAASECGDAPVRSGLGITRAQLVSSHPDLLLEKASLGYPEPRCVTCEDVPITDAAGVKRRYECITLGLSQHIPPGAVYPSIDTNAPVIADLVRNLKLLVETHGEVLTPAQRDLASVYLQTPSLACAGGSATVDQANATCAAQLLGPGADPAIAAAYATYRYCEGLRDHGSATLMSLEQERCIGAYRALMDATLTSATDAACRKDVPAGWDASFVSARLSRAAPEVPLPTDPTCQTKLAALQSDIASRLLAIDGFYTARKAHDAQVLAALAAGGASAPDVAAEREKREKALALDVDDVVGQLWAGLLPSGAAATGRTRSALSVQGFDIDRVVLLAAFSDYAPVARPPLVHAPLLLVVSDALRGITQRLEATAQLSDLACRFRTGGCGAGQRTTRTSELVGLIAALPDAALLTTRLTAATHLGSDAFRAVFVAARDKHVATLQAAANDAAGTTTYSPTFFTGADALKRRAGAPLARTVRDADQRSTRFSATGFFDLAGADELHTGLTADRRDALLADVELARQQLEGARTEYLQNEQAALAALITETQNQTARASVRSKLEQTVARFYEVTDDIAGLRASAAIEELRFADFMTTYQRALKEEQERTDYAIQRDPPKSFETSAKDAKFRISQGVLTLAGLAVPAPNATFAVQKGEIVNLRTTGRWAPSCALRDMPLPDGTKLAESDLAGVYTGPEGYTLTLSNGAFAAAKQETTHVVSSYTGTQGTRKACASANFGAGVTLGFFNLGFGLAGEDCVSETSGSSDTTSWSDSTGTGTDSRRSATFASGLRSKKTPFHTLPAGALLAVTLKENTDGTAAWHYQDVRVLQGQTSIVVPESGVMRFVVNDSGDCNATNPQTVAPDALTVEVAHLLPMGKLLSDLAQPMADVITWLKGEEGRLVAQGQMLPSDGAQLTAQAYQRLGATCHCDIAQFPRFAQQMFATWLGKEILSIERRVALLHKQREQKTLGAEADELSRELEGQDRVGRLQGLVGNLAFRNLDSSKLSRRMQDAARLATRHVYPVLKLRYPGALTALAGDAQLAAEADALLDADWATPVTSPTAASATLHDLARAEANFLTSLGSIVHAAQQVAPPTTVSSVVLRIPRYKDGPACEPVDRPFGSSTPRWRAMECAKARRIWDDLANPATQVLSFRLDPSDLYTASSGFAPLLCNAAAPVVTSMAVVVATDDSGLASSLNASHFSTRLVLGQGMLFPTTAGLAPYSLLAPAWLDSQVRVLFGQSDSALDVMATAKAMPGGTVELAKQAGLSPFASYELDVSGLRAMPDKPLDTAYELVLAMEVDPLPTGGGPLPGVAACQP